MHESNGLFKLFFDQSLNEVCFASFRHKQILDGDFTGGAKGDLFYITSSFVNWLWIR